MSINEIFDVAKLSVIVSHPASPSSGNPVRMGDLTGVAITDEDSAGLTSVDFRANIVYDLSAKAEDDDGNIAIAKGDQLFYVDADIDDGTGTLSKKVSGRFFGIAFEAITSGSTDTIRIMTQAMPGPGTLDVPESIGPDELKTSVAGDGLTGGGGSALAVVVDDSTIEIDTDTLRVKDVGITLAKIALHSLDGSIVKVAADANTVGAIPVVHRILLPSGADGNVDVALADKFRFMDMVVVLLGAGTTGSDVQAQNVTTAITDLIDASSGSDTDVFRPGQIDNAQQEIAAAANLRIAYSSTGGDFPGAEVYVTGLLVA